MLRDKIDLIVYDFDGVMTDNRVFVFEDGKEAVVVNRSDGLAVSEIRKMGIAQMIISTETNSVVRARAKKLRLPVIQSVLDKKITVRDILRRNKIDAKKVAFVGNDLNDLEVMSYVGWPIAPADASGRIKKAARLILKTNGGHGIVRELLDWLKK